MSYKVELTDTTIQYRQVATILGQDIPVSIQLPQWINIYPADRLVVVKVTEYKIEERVTMNIRFLTFDLQANRIELEVIVK
ncbi:YpmS family protein [bacterium LRH843]|nr:YpmS family protein [bacterium LRH843]